MVGASRKYSVKRILRHTYATSKKISCDRERVEVLCDIAEIMLEINKKREAKNLLDEALDRAKNISSTSFRALVLCDIAEILGKLDENKKAENILECALNGFDQISFSVDQKARASGKIAGTSAKIGELDRALDLTEDLSNKYGKATALAKIARELVEEGRKEEAKDKLENALQIAEDIVFSLEKRARAQADIAVGLSKNGEEEKALDIAREIPFGLSKKNSLTEIACSAVEDLEDERAGDILDECMTIAKNISKDHARASAYSEIARAMIKSGNEKRGDKILEKSLKLAEKISLPLHYRRVKTFCDIAAATKEKKDKEKTKKILDKALRVSNSISDDTKRAKALIRVVEVKLR